MPSRAFTSSIGNLWSRRPTPLYRECRRWLATATASPLTHKKEGDISDAFVSLSSREAQPLDDRFINIKQQLIAGHEEAVVDGFHRLIRSLETEIEEIKARGSSLIPSINFSELANPDPAFTAAHKKCGVAIIRSVVAPEVATAWLRKTQNYIAANPSTKAFPKHNPAVFELYWSPAQVEARAHPNLLRTQRFLMSHWSTPSSQEQDPSKMVSTSHPITYADRLRIRPPGDAAFALGPHVDGGSCERWEPNGYGLGSVYDSIFRGDWESHDPFDAAARLPVISDLYGGSNTCSMFRMYQGWLSTSRCAPGEGSLLVNPLFARATAYYLLRPFFSPLSSSSSFSSSSFLSPSNWPLTSPIPSSHLQGAQPGHGQELSPALHPHLSLENTMIPLPEVFPGDYIAWHCDTIHAVDPVNLGSEAASVMYIPACPLTERNAEFLWRQREAFRDGLPGPDFPGGKGEREFVGRVREGDVFLNNGDGKYSLEGQRAMGLRAWDSNGAAGNLLKRANEILGFS